MSNTSTPTKINTFSAGQTILSALVNQNFDQLFAALADIGTANLLDNSLSTPKYIDLSVTLGKLAAAVQAALCPSGTMMDYIGTAAPTGWVLADGNTIGDASSAATRANADTETLFVLLWNSFADAEAPVVTGRGVSAAADFAAHKKITVPDLRGRVRLGKDNMGGSTASRITSAGGNFDATVNGKTGGAQNHTLTTAQIPSHNHTQDAHTHTQNVHTHNIPVSTVAGGTQSLSMGAADAGTFNIANAQAVNQNTTATNQATGGGGSHPIVQPAMAISVIIKL